MPSQSYNVSLRSAYDKPRAKRAKYSITSLYNFLKKHTRKNRKEIIITSEVNEYIWGGSITKPPRSIEISIKEDKDNNLVYVFLKDSKAFKDFSSKGKDAPKAKTAKPKLDEKPKEEEKVKDEEKPKTEPKKTGKLRPMENPNKSKVETK